MSRGWSKSANHKWTKAIKPGTIGKVKVIGTKELVGKQVVYIGKMSGYEWFKLLEDVIGPNCNMKRGQVFVYMHKWIDWT